MKLVCLDLEGVLVPEIWIAFAEKTGIKELKLTTRDLPDYDVLLEKRISILDRNNLKLKDIQNVIQEMNPLEGAKDFIEELRSKTQLIILSDTFEEFAKPLMNQLKWPTLFCNRLKVDKKNNRIIGYELRQKDGKKKAVEAFNSINYHVFAAGDSYNDLAMIQTAKRGVFFKPPISITNENPNIPVVRDYRSLMKQINFFLEER